MCMFYTWFYRGDHIVPNMDEAFPKKKSDEEPVRRVSKIHTKIRQELENSYRIRIKEYWL